MISCKSESIVEETYQDCSPIPFGQEPMLIPLSEGNLRVRDCMGTDTGEMQFDSLEAIDV